MSHLLAQLNMVKHNWIERIHIVFVLASGNDFVTQDVVRVAQWCRDFYGKLDVVSLKIADIEKLHSLCEQQKLTPYISFHCQDPMKFLLNTSWASIVLIEAPDLNTGATLFRLAASAGAHLVVFFEYSQSGATAIKEAQSMGWKWNQDEILGHTYYQHQFLTRM